MKKKSSSKSLSSAGILAAAALILGLPSNLALANQDLEADKRIHCESEDGSTAEFEGNIENGWILELDEGLSVPYVGPIKKREGILLNFAASGSGSDPRAKLSMWDGNIGVELLLPEEREATFEAELHVFAVDIGDESMRSPVRCRVLPL